MTQALTKVGVRVGAAPSSYVSSWRRAAAREGVDNEPVARYARSPRSTRGATRA